MRAGRTEAGEINRFPARELVAHACNPRIGKFRAELVKAGRAKRFRGQPSRGAESGGGELRMSGTNSFVRVQFAGLAGDTCRHASIIKGGAQQCCFIPRNKPMLASPPAACDTAKKQKPGGRA